MSSYFARNGANQLVHISEVTRGLACGCNCVVCGEPLVAKQGAVREHHFAHSSGLEPCFANHESLLHLYAKQVIQEAGGLVVPVSPAVAEALGISALDHTRRIGLDSIEAEKGLGGVRPDLLACTELGVTLAIEVAYSSFCDLAKVAQFADAGLPVLEIDLRAFTPDGFDPKAVRAQVVEAVEGKTWLWPNEPAAEQVPDDRAAQATIAVIEPKKHLPEEIVVISGRWVSIRTFPNGDISVKAVSFDPDLVSMIKSVAKANCGRYRPGHKCWNIPRWRAETARATLKSMSERLSMALNDRLSPGRSSGQKDA